MIVDWIIGGVTENSFLALFRIYVIPSYVRYVTLTLKMPVSVI